MCHFLLPSRNKTKHDLDGRYADEAMELLVREMHDAGTRPSQSQAKVFGGGRMFSHKHKDHVLNIGDRNIEAARRLLRKHGLSSASESLAGVGHRSIVFDIASGDVWVRHSPEQASQRDVA